MYFFYLAKPKYGGWVSFTSHLAHCLNINPIFKMGKRLHKELKPFASGLLYQIVDNGFLKYANPCIILAFEKSHYHLFPILDEKTKQGHKIIIINHDCVEFKKECLQFLKDHPTIEVIAIRKEIADYTASFGIKTRYLYHPFYQYESNDQQKEKTRSVAISRVDFDKHQEIMIEANKLIHDEQDKINIYGVINP